MLPPCDPARAFRTTILTLVAPRSNQILPTYRSCLVLPHGRGHGAGATGGGSTVGKPRVTP